MKLIKMKILDKKNVKDENYDFFHLANEKTEQPFKSNISTTIFQILIWLSIVIVIIIISNKFFLNKF